MAALFCLEPSADYCDDHDDLEKSNANNKKDCEHVKTILNQCKYIVSLPRKDTFGKCTYEIGYHTAHESIEVVQTFCDIHTQGSTHLKSFSTTSLKQNYDERTKSSLSAVFQLAVQTAVAISDPLVKDSQTTISSLKDWVKANYSDKNHRRAADYKWELKEAHEPVEKCKRKVDNKTKQWNRQIKDLNRLKTKMNCATERNRSSLIEKQEISKQLCEIIENQLVVLDQNLRREERKYRHEAAKILSTCQDIQVRQLSEINEILKRFIQAVKEINIGKSINNSSQHQVAGRLQTKTVQEHTVRQTLYVANQSTRRQRTVAQEETAV
ncbi:unnamed protein product [Didymodactylos carnosus]|uniref:Uncharacterized protein n=1 Tax=Didymodactylos carnosus TaxID=1234261 RepID=A0A815YMC6_9BILA|nr:unnamed protein product [Didymodactylos carnosus]CAF4435023.1 unnamed protein product [Didymodactylos carnosus]